MGAFATVDDLAAHLGITIPDERTANAEAVLQEASDAIKLYTRNSLEFVADDTVELHPQGQMTTLRLPNAPVWWVSQLLVATVPGLSQGAVITNYEITKWGRVRWPLGDFSASFPVINAPVLEVDYAPLVVARYAHGYKLPGQTLPDIIPPVGATTPLAFTEIEDVPSELQTVCKALAGRLYQNPTAMGDEATGTWHGTYGAPLLSEDEKGLLSRWRRTAWGGGEQ